jgi:acetyltransferase-like isoleucine patch superfamily enzyme
VNCKKTNYFTVIRNKLPNASIRSGIRLEVEQWIIFMIGNLPGSSGMLLRTFFYRLMFQQLKGVALIQPGVTFANTAKLSIGNRFGCNTGTYINALGGIKIGNNVLLGNNVTISAGRHEIDNLSNSIFENPAVPLGIEIEDDVWIGSGAIVMPGVKIMQGSVIGANSVVTKDTAPYSINFGAPSRFSRFREIKQEN